MLPAVTRAEHFHALRNKADSMGYCKNLFFDKTGSKVSNGEFFAKLKVWFRLQTIKRGLGQYRGRSSVSLVEGCETVQNYYTKKFA